MRGDVPDVGGGYGPPVAVDDVKPDVSVVPCRQAHGTMTRVPIILLAVEDWRAGKAAEVAVQEALIASVGKNNLCYI